MLSAAWASPDMRFGDGVIRNREVAVEVALAGGGVDVDHIAVQDGDGPLMANPANTSLAALTVDTSLAQQEIQSRSIAIAYADFVEEYAVCGVPNASTVIHIGGIVNHPLDQNLGNLLLGHAVSDGAASAKAAVNLDSLGVGLMAPLNHLGGVAVVGGQIKNDGKAALVDYCGIGDFPEVVAILREPVRIVQRSLQGLGDLLLHSILIGDGVGDDDLGQVVVCRIEQHGQERPASEGIRRQLLRKEAALKFLRSNRRPGPIRNSGSCCEGGDRQGQSQRAEEGNAGEDVDKLFHESAPFEF